MFGDVFRDRTVWLSGHTGFKGSWLATWLLELGARVHGYALEPATQPSLFEQLSLVSRLHAHEIADVRNAAMVEKSIRAAKPDFVFHLAAQPLVRYSYQQPQETYATNVMGTVHVLEALRKVDRPCCAVFVTTDKVYENLESQHAYREEDPLGGFDPYSSSKAAAEIAIASYRRSFFVPNESATAIASARAGNVIGGGDWALDRIVPDSIRALQCGEPIPVRNKKSARPWQHVLEPLGGYLALAAGLAGGNGALRSAFNFGPGEESNRTVEEVVTAILARWPGTWEDKSDANAPHEAGRLNLAIAKAFRLLNWSPVWNFEETISETVAWYRGAQNADATEI
ncbi:MAG: CDP-glucose 4,6-dehydratase, partial [Verrucomicrobiota bacterium]|nr:CDP-glucose 4,6-dehydratase [Verrucomicrobiota bacterium]